MSLLLSIFNVAFGSEPAKRHALLVGCTTYVHCQNISPLHGPLNDVPAMSRLLSTRFGFPEANIRRLLGWPTAEADRPTYANIKQAFAQLAKDATAGGQVVIYLSGHGTQVPLPAAQTDPLDKRNPEPDGKDEVFLPADVKSWNGERLDNAIRDDEVGVWLDAIRAKGADVWIVFDCCHSGTMTRGSLAEEKFSPLVTGEVSRAVEPNALGIPDAAFAGKPAEVFRSANAEQGALEELSTSKNRGNLIAFYAAQAHEEAPDLPRPSGAEKKPENFFGLLTYTLHQTLSSSRLPLTYRDLGRSITARYLAERGGRGPTPLFAGDLDTDILGSKSWKPRALNLEKRGGVYRLNAGQLAGISTNSILAAYNRPDAKREDALGYFRVTEVLPLFSKVETLAFAGKPALALDSSADFLSCELERQEFGDLRLKLLIKEHKDEERQRQMERVRAAIGKVAAEVAATLEITADATAADYELLVVEPNEALRQFNLKLPQPELVIASLGQSPTGQRVAHQHYSLKESDLTRPLERDLRKLFRLRNLWRVTGQLGTSIGPESSGIVLEVAEVDGMAAPGRGKLLKRTVVPAGQWLEVRVRNEDVEDYWVTLLYIGADGNIDTWYSEVMKRGETEFPELRSQLNDECLGPEGFLVLAVPVRTNKHEPVFKILEQKALGIADEGGFRAPPAGPFGQLLSAAAGGTVTRNVPADLEDDSNPLIRTWSWTTVPK